MRTLILIVIAMTLDTVQICAQSEFVNFGDSDLFKDIDKERNELIDETDASEAEADRINGMVDAAREFPLQSQEGLLRFLTLCNEIARKSESLSFKEVFQLGIRRFGGDEPCEAQRYF